MGIETERKFLVDHEKWRMMDKPSGIHYRQGYMLNNKLQTIRIRVADTQAFLNLKSKETAMTRKEYEYEIPLTDGIEILNAFAKNEIEKIRYRILFAHKIWEIDEFLGNNVGLIVAEIELKNESEKFEMPDWIGTEVTRDGSYTNASLSVKPFCNW